MNQKNPQDKSKKSLIISIIGLPNAGKSTLINNIVGEKLSGVSPRVQTTRNLIRGIRIFDDLYQLVFIDSPGIINPKNVMDELMMRFAKIAIKESELFLILLDIRTPNSPNFQIIIDNIKKYKEKKKILVINKIDFFNKSKEAFEEKKKEINEKFNCGENEGLFDQFFYISLTENLGMTDLIEFLKNQCAHSEWIYDENQISDSSEKFSAAEITREKIFNTLRMELPYSVMVKTDKWEENDNLLKIYQTIFVNKKAHKSILIGANGSMLKKIGIASRTELELIFGKKIHLELYVKVKEGWTKNESFIQGTLGFESS
jgi:GTP-binding protein Era